MSKYRINKGDFSNPLYKVVELRGSGTTIIYMIYVVYSSF